MSKQSPALLRRKHHLTPAEAAMAHALMLPPGCAERLIITLLYDRRAGSMNPIPWSAIKRHLEEHGISLKKKEFQTTILARSRSSDYFIGSRLNKPGGYCLIWDEADYQNVRSDCMVRDYQIQRNREHLDSIVRRFGWRPSQRAIHQWGTVP